MNSNKERGTVFTGDYNGNKIKTTIKFEILEGDGDIDKIFEFITECFTIGSSMYLQSIESQEK